MTRKRERPQSDQISELTTSRLSVYSRCLDVLDRDGRKTVSSQELANGFQLNAAQIRKDLAHFGEFGVRGVGYYVKDLRRHLRQILGLDRGLKVIIMGAGNLGMALADYPGFRHEGFDIVALFDIARERQGQYSRTGVIIRSPKDLERIVARERIDIGVIAAPASSAQEVLDELVHAGIRAILNFSSGALRVPAGVKMKHVDLTLSLESLSFFLARGGDDEQTN